ncbi:MAG: Radial spoke head protein 9 [Marteilia pararefringens]
MNLSDLRTNISLLEEIGVFFPIEKKILLENSLKLLKIAQKCSTVLLIGKLECLQNDYYLCMCHDVLEDEDGDKEKPYRLFYSTNAAEWIHLQIPEEKKQKAAQSIHSRFVGDPNLRLTVQNNSDIIRSEMDESKEFGAEELNQISPTESISEEERLASFTDSLIRTTWMRVTNQDVKSPMYNSKLFGKEWAIKENSDLTKFDENYEIWMNLLWVGQYFLVKERKFSNFYWGRGEKVLDLPFMID